MSSFGQILKQVGEFGRFQKCLLAALCVSSIFSAFDVFSQVFSGLGFPHRCNTDWILERAPNLTGEQQRNLTIPRARDGQLESCQMFAPVDLDLETMQAFGLNRTTGCVDGWEFDVRPGESSIVTEFDLVCDRKGLAEASQSGNLAGMIVGSLAFGAISDRFGRRLSVLLSGLVLLFFAVLTAFSPNIYVYIVFRFLSGAGVIVTSSFVMIVEWTDSSKSALCTMLIMSFFSVGEIILSGVAYFCTNWRTRQLILSSPLLLYLAALFWFLPESARWLTTQGRLNEANQELRRAARTNRKSLPEGLLDEINTDGSPDRGNLLELFQSSHLRKITLIMSFNWFAGTLLFYGLSLNIGSFGLNIYLTQLVFALIEIPANMAGLTLIQTFGRRRCQAFFLFFGGALCLVATAIPKELPVVVTVIAMLGKFASAASCSTAHVYTAELYPTKVRNNGVGVNSVSARLAGTLAPLIRLLEVYHYSAPMVAYGLIPVAASGFCLLLPETLNVELPDHTELKPSPSVQEDEFPIPTITAKM